MCCVQLKRAAKQETRLCKLGMLLWRMPGCQLNQHAELQTCHNCLTPLLPENTETGKPHTGLELLMLYQLCAYKLLPQLPDTELGKSIIFSEPEDNPRLLLLSEAPTMTLNTNFSVVRLSTMCCLLLDDFLQFVCGKCLTTLLPGNTETGKPCMFAEVLRRSQFPHDESIKAMGL